MYEAGQVIQILEEEGYQVDNSRLEQLKTWGLPSELPSMGSISRLKLFPIPHDLPHQGPNDAGDVSIDEGGFQLACGGHVTPPTTNLVSLMRSRRSRGRKGQLVGHTEDIMATLFDVVAIPESP